MDVCLITPPSPFLLDERVFLSLGILKVAAVLEQAGHRVEHVDLAGVENYCEAVREHLLHTKATVFGLTATTPQLPAAMQIVRVIRDCDVQGRIILGGPHATLVNAAAKRGNPRALLAMNQLYDTFDTVVAGDGEKAMLVALQTKEPLIDADDPKTDLFLTNQALEETPWPARHLVDMESYHYTVDGIRATSLIAQLGCPFGCCFCGGRKSAMLRRIRTRTIGNISAEIQRLYEWYGLRAFMFYDDELNVNKDVVRLMNHLAELGKELGVEWRLRGFVKAELFTDEQAEAMYRAGFRWLLCGFESGSPRILDNINKKATREENTRCLQIARRRGIKVKALMSLGHPAESPETILDTQRWLLETHPDDFDATVITTYPGTPYYDDAVESRPGVWTYTAPRSGDRLHAYDCDFTKDAAFYKGHPGEYKSFVFTDYMTAEELVQHRDRLESEVRQTLNIPFNAGAPGIRYEASFGQLPGHILKVSA